MMLKFLVNTLFDNFRQGSFFESITLKWTFFIPAMYAFLHCPAQRERTVDSFMLESLNYNDIQKIYSSDSTARKIPFFQSPTLDSTHIVLKTEIRKIFISRDDSTRLVCYEMVRPSISAEGSSVFINWKEIGTEISRPVFVYYSVSGRIKFFRADSSVSVAALGILKEVLSYLQFVPPPVPQKKQWEAIEENTRGKYLANYTVALSADSQSTIIKKIRRYLRLKKSFKNQKINPDSEIRFVINKKGEDKSISVSEAETVEFGKDTVSMRATEVSLFRINEKNWMGLEDEDAVKLVPSKAYALRHTLSEDLTDEQIASLAFKNTLGEDDWSSLKSRLPAAPGLSKSAKDSLTLKFRALFSLYPSACDEALNLLLTIQSGSESFNLLLYSLSITQKAEAAEALATLARLKKEEPNVEMLVLPVLATAKNPTQKAIQSIRSLTFMPVDSSNEFIASTAMLTLAAMIHNYFPLRPSPALNEANELIRRLVNETDTMKRILILGNIGLPIVIPELKKIIQGRQVSVTMKAAAISAMLLIEGKITDDYLERLSHSSQPAIKKEAVQVMQARQKIKQ